jgi:hypothetical protein
MNYYQFNGYISCKYAASCEIFPSRFVSGEKTFSIPNYSVFGLCPLSGILEARKHNVSETESVSVLRWGETPTLLGPLDIFQISQKTDQDQFQIWPHFWLLLLRK